MTDLTPTGSFSSDLKKTNNWRHWTKNFSGITIPNDKKFLLSMQHNRIGIENTYWWNMWPHGSFLAFFIWSQQIAQLSSYPIRSFSPSSSNLWSQNVMQIIITNNNLYQLMIINKQSNQDDKKSSIIKKNEMSYFSWIFCVTFRQILYFLTFCFKSENIVRIFQYKTRLAMLRNTFDQSWKIK